MGKDQSNIRRPDWPQSVIADLFPGYFAMVMATGIVSIASHFLGFWFAAEPLLWLNIIFYIALVILTLARILLFPRRFWDDFSDHNRGVGFFTMVAGTCVLGVQLIELRQAYGLATWLLFLGVALWAILIYGIFANLTVKEGKPPFEKGIHGGWLVSTVATQSVSILSALITSHLRAQEEEWLLFSLILFLVGCMLYLVIITLILYRFWFFRLLPAELTPLYWINMGAVAITALAGTNLALHSQRLPLLTQLLPFTNGFTLFFWAIATWWIPLLLLLGFWRYGVRRLRFEYDPQYWGMVFPVGMYTACTYQLAKIKGLTVMFVIPRYFIYAALLAWFLVFAGFLKSLVKFFPSFGQR